jgi:hypothetical protein
MVLHGGKLMISIGTRAEMESGMSTLTLADKGYLFWLKDELAFWTWDGTQLIQVSGLQG